MAITTLDQIVAGFQIPQQFAKIGIIMSAPASMRGHTSWYASGRPGAAAANAAGVNGAAVSGAIAGAIPRVNPVAGNAHLARLAVTANQPGSLWLIDRLWHNSGLSATLTTAQAITPSALPARDANADTLGEGIMAALEWSATGGAGVPNVTLTYTNQDGTAGKTAVLTAVSTAPIGTFEMFPLAAGDTGIRAPTSLIQSATRTSGAYHLVLFRLLAQIEVTAANIGNAIDAITSGMPQIFDNSVLQLVWLQNATTAATYNGQYIETQG